MKNAISLQIRRQWAYHPGRWVPASEAQLPWQKTAVASDPALERPGLAPTHLPRWQRCRREKNHHDATTDNGGL